MRLAYIACLLTQILVTSQTVNASDLKTSFIQKKETPVVKYLKPLEITELPSGLEGIDCIYLINLDVRPEKWNRVKPFFDERGLKVNRVSAVNGWELTDEIQKELAGPYEVRLRGGQTGCILSHLSILNDAYKRGFDMVWVTEDDLKFVGDVHKIPELIKKLTKLDPEWDVFYTNNTNRGFPKLTTRPDQTFQPYSYYRKKIKINDDFSQVRRRQGTQSMIFSRRGIEKMLNYFTHVYLWTAIDNDMHMIPNIKQYCPNDDIVTRWGGSKSDTMSSSSLNPERKKA